MKATLLVGVGGALGALARYGVATAWPVKPGGFPFSTLLVNSVGCLLIGVLMAAAVGSGVRLFLGTGALGGFTTFSGYVAEARDLPLPLAACYLAVTLCCALLAVWLGSRVRR